jgi:hypothetical protein
LTVPIPDEDTDTTTLPHEDTQWAPLTYPNLTEFLDEIQNSVMPFFSWGEESSEEDISLCPSRPPPPIAPPPIPPSPILSLPMPPFQSFARYLRDTRPCQHRTPQFYVDRFNRLQDVETVGMTSAAWSDRIQNVHEFRQSQNKDCFARVHQQRVHVNYRHNSIFTIPAILYASFNNQAITPAIRVLLQAQAPYLEAFPTSSINQLVIITVLGLNQEGSVVNNIKNTLFFVYQGLHTLVEREIAEERERLRLDWDQRILDSWDVARKRKDVRFHEDYGWLQYRRGNTVQGMIEQFDGESWEIYRRSDVLWEEKDMLWISSLREHQRMLLEFAEDPESETDESLSPSNSASIDFDVLPDDSTGNSVTGIEGQSSTL